MAKRQEEEIRARQLLTQQVSIMRSRVGVGVGTQIKGLRWMDGWMDGSILPLFFRSLVHPSSMHLITRILPHSFSLLLLLLSFLSFLSCVTTAVPGTESPGARQAEGAEPLPDAAKGRGGGAARRGEAQLQGGRERKRRPRASRRADARPGRGASHEAHAQARARRTGR